MSLNFLRGFFTAGAVAALAAALTLNHIVVDAFWVRNVGSDPGQTARISFVVRFLLLVSATSIGTVLLSFLKTKVFRIYSFVFPLMSLAAVALYKAEFGLRDPPYLWFVHEDGPVEYLSSLVSILGAAVSARAAAVSFRRRLWFVCAFASAFALVMLFIGLEEISYGQRIFRFATPQDLHVINRQHEFNLHNITSVEWFTLVMAPMIVSAYGLCGWPASQVLKFLFPHLARDHHISLIFPPWYTSSFFVPLSIYWYTIHYSGVNFVYQDQEPAELFMVIGLFLTALHTLLGLSLSRNGVEWSRR